MEMTNAVAVIGNGAGDIAVATREQSEVQAAIISAKKFPRNEEAAFAKALKAFERPAMAEEATYSFPRGGSTVSGPSVACAREVARCWGNIRYGFNIIEDTGDSLLVRGWALDLETNARPEMDARFKKLVQRKVNTPEGKITKWVEPDERDLRELVNKHGSILERNCLLKILPKDVVEQMLQVARTTLEKAAAGKLSTNREDTVRKLAVGFERLGVTVAMLEQYLGHPLNVITAAEVASLNEIGAALKDGQAKREEFFSFEVASSGGGDDASVTSSIKDKLRKKSAEPKAAADEPAKG